MLQPCPRAFGLRDHPAPELGTWATSPSCLGTRGCRGSQQWDGRLPAASLESEQGCRGWDGTLLPHHSRAWEGCPSAAATPVMPHPPGQVPPGPPGHAWGDFCTREPSGRQRSRTPCSPGDCEAPLNRTLIIHLPSPFFFPPPLEFSFPRDVNTRRVLRGLSAPLMTTCERAGEGGRWRGDILGDTAPTGLAVAPRLGRGVPGRRGRVALPPPLQERTVAQGVGDMAVMGEKRRAQVLRGNQDAGLSLGLLRCFQLAVSPGH